MRSFQKMLFVGVVSVLNLVQPAHGAGRYEMQFKFTITSVPFKAFYGPGVNTQRRRQVILQRDSQNGRNELPVSGTCALRQDVNEGAFVEHKSVWKCWSNDISKAIYDIGSAKDAGTTFISLNGGQSYFAVDYAYLSFAPNSPPVRLIRSIFGIVPPFVGDNTLKLYFLDDSIKADRVVLTYTVPGYLYEIRLNELKYIR